MNLIQSFRRIFYHALYAQFMRCSLHRKLAVVLLPRRIFVDLHGASDQIKVCRTSSKLMSVAFGLECSSRSPTKMPMYVPSRIRPAQIAALAQHASTVLPDFAHSDSRLSLAEVLELGLSSVLPSANLDSRSLSFHGSVCFVVAGCQIRCRTSSKLMSVILGLECSSRLPHQDTDVRAV